MTGVEAKAVLDADTGYTTGQLFALYRLAEIVNENAGWLYWQKNAALAEEINSTRSTVSRWLRDFVADGWIEPLDEGDGRNSKATRYRWIYEVDVTRRVSSDEGRVSSRHTQRVSSDDTACAPTTRAEEREQQERTRGGETHTRVVDRFDEFWELSPVKAGKPAARRNWEKAIKTTDPQDIIDGMARYRDWVETTGAEKIKYPQGWLTDERWLDVLPTPMRKETAAEKMERLNPTTHQDAIDVEARPVRFNAIEVGR